MTTYHIVMERKAICKMMKKQQARLAKQRRIHETRQRDRAFEEQIARYGACKAGYANINGIVMPVLTA